MLCAVFLAAGLRVTLKDADHDLSAQHAARHCAEEPLWRLQVGYDAEYPCSAEVGHHRSDQTVLRELTGPIDYKTVVFACLITKL